jgi:hypothetical protein
MMEEVLLEKKFLTSFMRKTMAGLLQSLMKSLVLITTDNKLFPTLKSLRKIISSMQKRRPSGLRLLKDLQKSFNL